jgi:hypothetical protein
LRGIAGSAASKRWIRTLGVNCVLGRCRHVPIESTRDLLWNRKDTHNSQFQCLILEHAFPSTLGTTTPALAERRTPRQQAPSSRSWRSARSATPGGLRLYHIDSVPRVCMHVESTGRLGSWSSGLASSRDESILGPFVCVSSGCRRPRTTRPADPSTVIAQEQACGVHRGRSMTPTLCYRGLVEYS